MSDIEMVVIDGKRYRPEDAERLGLAETKVVLRTPERPHEDPEGTSGEDPEGTSGEDPEGTSGEDPEGTSGEHPEGTSGEDPEGTSGEAEREAPAKGRRPANKGRAAANKEG